MSKLTTEGKGCEDYAFLFGAGEKDYGYDPSSTRFEACPEEPGDIQKVFSVDDIAEVLAYSYEGEGVGCEEGVLFAGQLKDGRFFFIDSSCDYTGWDCQAGAGATVRVSVSLEHLKQFGMTMSERAKLFGAAQ